MSEDVKASVSQWVDQFLGRYLPTTSWVARIAEALKKKGVAIFGIIRFQQLFGVPI